MNGILMLPEMKQATVAGIKTQTRRVMMPQPQDDIEEMCNTTPEGWQTVGHSYKWSESADMGNKIWKPRYHVGETLYIKEAIVLHSTGTPIRYADGLPVMVNGASLDADDWKWKSNILSPLFLPERFARYHIQITDITPQRLQEITEYDAKCEGIKQIILPNLGTREFPVIVWSWEDYPTPHIYDSAKLAYFALWNLINPDCPTSLNPQVWRYGFKLLPEVRKNG